MHACIIEAIVYATETFLFRNLHFMTQTEDLIKRSHVTVNSPLKGNVTTHGE